MPLQSQIQPSCSAGELSPTLFARVDLAKFKVGVALLYNMFVDFRGGATNRPGTQFIGQCKSFGARIVRFQFSTVQSYILEFGDLYIRVIRDGAYVTEAAKNITGITQAAPGVITVVAHGFAAGDWIALSGIGGMTQLNNRTVQIAAVLSANTFTTIDPVFGSLIDTTAYSAYTAGGTASRIYTVISPYALADVPLLKFTQSADVMTITHPSYAPRDLTRTGHAAWTLTVINFASTIASPTGGVVASSAGAANAYYIWVITSVNKSGEESIGRFIYQTAGSGRYGDSPSTTYFVRWTGIADAVQYIIYRSREMIWAGGAANFAPQQDYGFVGTSGVPVFADAVITPDFSKNPPLHRNPFSPGAIKSVLPNAVGAGYTPLVDVTTTIADATGTGAVVRPIVAVVGGVSGVKGYEIVDGGTNYTAPTITVVSGGGAGATSTVTLESASDVYPAAVTYFQQRKVFGGSTNYPTTLWMTRPGAPQNMDVSPISQDDDALTFTLSSLQVNNIKSMIASTKGLLVLTGYGIWLVTGSANNPAVGPNSINAEPQEYGGASDLQPLAVLSDVIYVQNKGSVVRNLVFNLQTNIFSGNDLSYLSNHFFTGYTLVSWTYADSPFKLIWVVRSDGSLLTLTYLKDQEVFGWGRHTTVGGVFGYVESITANNIDQVYFTVSRTVIGPTPTVTYVELLATRLLDNSSNNAWFLDCALQYSGAATNTVTGLWHLEGQTLSVYADGSKRNNAVVTNGTITVSGAPAILIRVGIGYTSKLQTLPLDTGGGEIQGKRKEIPALTVRVNESRGFQIGSSFAALQAWSPNVQNFNGSINLGLYTGDYRRTISKGWDEQAQLCFQQDDPYPMQILGVIPEFSIGDLEMRARNG